MKSITIDGKDYEYQKKRKCFSCEKIIKDKNKSGYCIRHLAGAKYSNKSEYRCLNCEAVLFRSPSQVGDRVFCNYRCVGDYQHKRPMEEHPLFGTGMSQEHLQIRIDARDKLNKAIRFGRIKRQNCAECDKSDAEAHHPDYSEPLKVVWLCSKHHKKLHSGVKSYVSKYVSA